MGIYETSIFHGRRRLTRAMLVVVAAVLAVALPLTVQAHGRDPIPSDPVLREQYQSGLKAYLGNDYAAALQTWRPLAERKTESSAIQIFLGFMSARGQGVPEDRAAAAEWYLRAADQDNGLAQIRLGFLYRADVGIPRDLVQAYLWASLATRHEKHVGKVAEMLLEALIAEMTAPRIAEAKRLAADWVASHGSAE